jgi:enolase
MIKLDGTKNKKKLGANAILGVSMAVAKAASLEKKIPLYMYLREIYNLKLKNYSLPKPMMVVIEGGKHAINSIDFQEYLISPYKYNSVKENIRCGIEIYLKLKDLLLKKGYSCNIGNEGGFALNNLNSNEDPLKLINDAIIKSGYNPMKDVGISLDIASSEFYKNKKYFLKKENIVLNSFDLINYYEKIIKKYPIVSIEDGLSQDDWENWIKLNQKFKDQILVIGDDLTVTNKKLLEKAISLNAINSIIIKLNQIGTLTETIECFLLARKNNISTIMSHRGGGETNDTAMIDLAVALNCEFVKVGPTRGERVEKYNRLMEIEDELKGSFFLP